jgi:hypothetical protein
MARAVEWRRYREEYTEAILKSNFHYVKIGSIAEGETLTRIRFTWQATHPAGTAADAAGFLVCQGILVVPSGTLEAALPEPFTDFDEPWVWWEGGIFQPLPTQDMGSGDTELDAYPVVDLQRDAKAQRVADAGGSDIWFITATSLLSPGQCDHYLTVACSILVILAP